MFSVRRPVCSLTLLIALAGAAGLPARAAAVPPNPNLECGDTVTASARLTKDLTGTAGALANALGAPLPS
jgi:hypothetical protein